MDDNDNLVKKLPDPVAQLVASPIADQGVVSLIPSPEFDPQHHRIVLSKINFELKMKVRHNFSVWVCKSTNLIESDESHMSVFRETHVEVRRGCYAC